jgi:uncharacterized protein (TIGR03067 family)
LPFVLCYLEGKTNEEAAALLGWPKGTVLSSLARARERLRGRLTRRGVALTSGLLAVLAAENAAPAAISAALAESTLRAALLFAGGSGAAGGIAAPLVASAQSMLRDALLAKLKLAVALFLAVSVAGTGTVALVYRATGRVHEDIMVEPATPTNTIRANSTAVAPGSERPLADRDRLQGAWNVAVAEQHGQRIDALNDRRLVIAGNRFALSDGRGEVGGIIPSAGLEGDFTLEPANPRRIDLKRNNNDLTQRSWHLRGIYEFEGDDLKVCLSRTFDTEPPLELTTKPGSEQLLLILKRE